MTRLERAIEIYNGRLESVPEQLPQYRRFDDLKAITVGTDLSWGELTQLSPIAAAAFCSTPGASVGDAVAAAWRAGVVQGALFAQLEPEPVE